MSLDIVNGYLCLNCADVALAKQGINPAKPQDNPQSPQYDPAQAKADHGPAFQLSGVLAAASAPPSTSGSPATTTPASATPASAPPPQAVGLLAPSAASLDITA